MAVARGDQRPKIPSHDCPLVQRRVPGRPGANGRSKAAARVWVRHVPPRRSRKTRLGQRAGSGRLGVVGSRVGRRASPSHFQGTVHAGPDAWPSRPDISPRLNRGRRSNRRVRADLRRIPWRQKFAMTLAGRNTVGPVNGPTPCRRSRNTSCGGGLRLEVLGIGSRGDSRRCQPG